MKICFSAPPSVFGGGSRIFVWRLSSYLLKNGIQVCYDPDERYDLLIDIAGFIPPDKIRRLKKEGKKILFRLDGVFTPAMCPDYERKNEVFRIKHNELADAVVYQSRFVRDQLCKGFIGDPHPNSMIIYNGIDPEIFYPKEERVSKNILIFGIFRRRACYNALLDGILSFNSFQKAYPDFTLIIKGLIYGEKGEEIERSLKEILSKIGNNRMIALDLHSRVSNLNAPSLYRSSAMLLHLRYGDSSPNVVVEAMACGSPVVGMGFGGDPEYIGDSGAIIDPSYKGHDHFPRADIEKVCSAMEFVVSHYEELRKKAINRAQKFFSMEKIGRRYTDLIRRIYEF